MTHGCLAMLVACAAMAFLFACASEPDRKGVAKAPDDSGTPGPRPAVAVAVAANSQPVSPTVAQSDDYHGTPVADPYRWLEDQDSPETGAWVAAQNAHTQRFLARSTVREPLETRLRELWNYPRFSPPGRRGTRYFFSKNDGLQNQAVVYWSEGLTGTPKVLLDPNTLSEDGTVSLADARASNDGRLYGYALSRAGSDWLEWRVRDVASGEDLKDRIQWVKFSTIAWSPDGTGFFYARFPEPAPGEEMKGANKNQKLYWHKLGTAQDEDALVYERADEPDWGFSPEVSEDGRYLVIPSWVGTDTRNRVFYLDLLAHEGVRPLIVEFDASHDFIGNDGPVFYFKTDAAAPRLRVIAVDLRSPERASWREIVPEGPDTLADVRLVADRFVLTLMQDVHHRVEVRGRDGALQGEVSLPGLGALGSLSGRRADTEAFFAFTSFTQPTTIYRYEFSSGRLSVFRDPELKFDPERFATTLEWYRSKDGTRIPMYLVRRKDAKKDGTNPVLLYGYGGFNVSMMPGFSPSIVVWLEMGGVYAHPALRGGGEYGEAWHQAGMLEKKQNVFDDFHSAAEWLIAEKWTSSRRLAISGASNGGLLVGACMVQRPELYGACLPAVGVMDMLRFHKFTIGWAWTSEYGSADDPAQFKTLHAYSPLHNLKPGTHYPATLVTTADHDDRVVPAHSFKFAATLQAAQAGEAPCLIRIETKAGHGAGIPTSKLIEEAADKWSFLAQVFSMPAPR